MCLQPSQINLAVYPLGESRTVVTFERFVKLLDESKLIYLNGLIANRLIDIEESRQASNLLENAK